MEIKIFDVDRGFCAVVITDDHRTILLDSGYSHTVFRPSQYIVQKHCNSLECLIVPAYTEEHLSGFADILNQSLEHCLPIHFYLANPSVDAEKFPGLQRLNQRFKNALAFMSDTPPGVGSTQVMKIDDVAISFFWNNYSEFQDADNLSLVTFLSYRDINIIFPSNLQTAGWLSLLKSPQFCDRLRQVNIFVAANHGKEDGYCPSVFDYCKPEVIIVSNELEQPISPRMMQRYQSHAYGSPLGVSHKKLLTTYDEGTITITKYLDRLRQVQTQLQDHKNTAAQFLEFEHINLN
ncbi:hypothetical protein [Chroogloeocystis siderophila]|jgi:beta-lactamase superfamily II metal-dependent hydrolase|uniref:Metallo-beta-lactamase domain-containing protein n=1 Tax=Chroogloeocystis siderophila 5.2 s.c.1 TaxID=247279 RepID=A0A1U7HEE7_9CHRO|nr:hypothetical protein [Chroogloeocystis siderophila]OKH21953.1 hypothetical protein NIES1031_21005 [Chroogloeocystis siderophila 5.2 s.c.1]